MLDRWAYFPPGERFFRDPKNNLRVGPTAEIACLVVSGSATLKLGDPSIALTAPHAQGSLSLKAHAKPGPLVPVAL